METPQLKVEHDFDSDDYNSLLVIEKKINSMIENEMFSEQEIKILGLICEGYLFGDIEAILGVGRSTVAKIYKNVCERISFSLGGEFTNEGFIREISKRKHLTKAEQRKLSKFMESNMRYRILRRPTNEV